jgi:hypothetical protein
VRCAAASGLAVAIATLLAAAHRSLWWRAASQLPLAGAHDGHHPHLAPVFPASTARVALVQYCPCCLLLVDNAFPIFCAEKGAGDEDGLLPLAPDERGRLERTTLELAEKASKPRDVYRHSAGAFRRPDPACASVH